MGLLEGITRNRFCWIICWNTIWGPRLADESHLLLLEKKNISHMWRTYPQIDFNLMALSISFLFCIGIYLFHIRKPYNILRIGEQVFALTAS